VTIRRRIAAILAVLGVVALFAPTLWLRSRAAGRIHTESAAPSAEVLIVFGAQLQSGGRQPRPFLAGRLDTALALLNAGKARAVLLSGDARGDSGDEIAAMTRYLRDRGLPAKRIVADPHGLDTYDTCRRAREVFGVRRALLVSQELHLPRAVALCRHFGIDADGVRARCPGCTERRQVINEVREIPAAVKAAWEVRRDRPPAVATPPQPRALQDALAP